MSTIAVNAITDANDGNTTTINGVTPNSANLVGKNLIINGAMQIAQRGTSVTGVTTSAYRTVDRFKLGLNIGTWTLEQSTDAPDGFSNSFKIDCTTAVASTTGGYLQLQHSIEALNLQQLAYGTSSAKAMTFSFWVKSNKTGTGTVELQQKDNSDRQVTPSYTINSANTWEYKTISIPADSAGLINNDSGTGLWIIFWLNSGSAYTGGTNRTTWTAEVNADRNATNIGIGGSTDDYFQITGVQLELGESATEFEHRPYGTELSLCQRYYQNPDLSGTRYIWAYPIDNYTGTHYRAFTYIFPTPMRTSPTCTVSASSNGSLAGGQPSIQQAHPSHALIRSDTTATTAYAYITSFTASAEL